MKPLNRYLCCLILLAQIDVAYAKPNDVNNECDKMVKYALVKHDEYSHGKTIDQLMDEEQRSFDEEEEKFYKLLVVEILDTFAVWDDPIEKARVDLEIKEHFYSICDPKRIKGLLK